MKTACFLSTVALATMLAIAPASAGYKDAGDCANAVVDSCNAKHAAGKGLNACVKSGVNQCIKAFPSTSPAPAKPRLPGLPLAAKPRPVRDCSATAKCGNTTVSCSVKGDGNCQAKDGVGASCQTIKANGTADEPAQALCP